MNPPLLGSPQKRKVLVFRLSSLGDVILASTVLSALADPTLDWVVAREFAPLLRGHPRIGRLWEFDRASGLAGWLELLRQLRKEGYDEVLDLHGSLRTRVARVFLGNSPRWRRLSKERWRLYGLYVFKRYWPQSLRPRPFVARFARFAGGAGGERPDLTHLLGGVGGVDCQSAARGWRFQSFARRLFLCDARFEVAGQVLAG